VAWYEGGFGTAAGTLKSILDDKLPLNTKWHIEDPNAGTNVGVYHNYDASNYVDYIVVVRDNQANYTSLELWEAWDSGAHVGVGKSLVSATGYVIRKAAGNYGLSVLDHRIIFVTLGAKYAYYVGQPRRFDTKKNMPLMICHSSSSTNNPLGYNPDDSGVEWRCLLDHDGVSRTIRPYLHVNATIVESGIRSKNDRVWIVETLVFENSNKWALGVLEGAMHCRFLRNMVDGDTATVDGTVWLVVFSGSYGACLVRKN